MAASTTNPGDAIIVLKLELIRHIKGQLEGEKFNILKEIMNIWKAVKPYYLEKCETFEKLWEILEQRQHIKNGNYKFLKDCFVMMRQNTLVDLVNKFEQGMKDATIGQTVPIPPSSGQLPEYKITSDPRGLCVIINNVEFHQVQGGKKLENRPGSDVDAEKLDKLFGKLKFKTQNHRNLRRDDIIDVVKKVAGTDHTTYDCFVLCILTHGSIGCIYGTDGLEIEICDICHDFKGIRCRALRAKPKLFFIQACQGNINQTGFRTDSSSNHLLILPNETDFLIGYSTVPGFVSYRHPQEGSWYISKLVEVLGEYCDQPDCDLMSIMTKVNEEVSKRDATTPAGSVGKQCPLPYTTLRKKVYLRSY